MKKPKKQPQKPLSGWQKVKASGRVCVMLTMLPQTRETIRKAARIEGRSVANFVCHHAYEAACQVLAREFAGG